MIRGVHAIRFAGDAPAVRAFFRDVLGFGSIDAGDGWLIFRLPPAELGVHPVEGGPSSERWDLYLMCDDIEATVAELSARGAHVRAPVQDAGFGRVTSVEIPGGGEIGLYEPRHAVAIGD